MSVRTKYKKYRFIFFTASFDSDKVLSAGDTGYNLFMFNTSISEDLSNKSAKSTQSRRAPFFFLSLSLVIIFSEWKPRLRKCCTFQTVQRGWLHSNPPYLLSLPLSQALMLKRREMQGAPALDFILVLQPWWTPVSVYRQVFFPVLSRIFTRISGNYDKICGISLASVKQVVNAVSNKNTLFSYADFHRD